MPAALDHAAVESGDLGVHFAVAVPMAVGAPVKIAETDVARPVVAYLRAIGWRVYQEVQEGRGDARADIVATWRDRLVWVVECKAALSWDLLHQAEAWTGRAHRVSVAVPSRKMHGIRWTTDRPIEERVVRSLRLGLFVGGTERVKPPILAPDRREVARWWRTLRPEHEAGFAEAGSAAGGHWTPFRGTVVAIVAQVRKVPGLTTKELIASIDHHYGSDGAAVRNMVNWIGSSALAGTGLCARRDGGAGPWRWFLDPEAEVVGRCRETTCAMPVAASCRLCHERLCADCVATHRCRCHGRWHCPRPGVKVCGCGLPGTVVCATHERCSDCERREEEKRPRPEWQQDGAA